VFFLEFGLWSVVPLFKKITISVAVCSIFRGSFAAQQKGVCFFTYTTTRKEDFLP